MAARRGEEAAADEEEEQEERKVCATDATGHNKHIGIYFPLSGPGSVDHIELANCLSAMFYRVVNDY